MTGTLDGQSASRTSAALPVLRRLTRTPEPRIVDTPVAGHRLAVRTGEWGPGEVGLGIGWYRDGHLVAGGDHYRVRSADRHHRITVVVTGRRAGYAPASRTSQAVRVR